MLGKIQRRAAIWILGAFKTSPSFGIEAIVGLISINLHLQKLSERLQLQVHTLLSSHILQSLMEPGSNSSLNKHQLSLGALTQCQCELINEPLVDMNNCFNEVFPSFVSLHSEFSSGCRVIDIFSSQFSFHLSSKHKDDNFKAHIQQLDNLAIKSSSIPLHALIITDASIKNNIATSISHIHIHNKPITKTLHHAVNIMSTEAELFVIRCGINQATNSNDVSKIIIFTDFIYTAKKIFDLTFHPFQSHTASILNELQSFFSHHQENVIEFWECSSHSNWPLHKAVYKKTKSFSTIPLLSCKLFWNFSKKKKRDDITNRWRMIFQASDLKRKHFLNLINSDNNIIKPSYIKGGL